MTSNPLQTRRPTGALDVAFGDHQVTNYQADVEGTARSGRRAPPVAVTEGRCRTPDVIWHVQSIKRS